MGVGRKAPRRDGGGRRQLVDGDAGPTDAAVDGSVEGGAGSGGVEDAEAVDVVVVVAVDADAVVNRRRRRRGRRRCRVGSGDAVVVKSDVAAAPDTGRKRETPAVVAAGVASQMGERDAVAVAVVAVFCGSGRRRRSGAEAASESGGGGARASRLPHPATSG